MSVVLVGVVSVKGSPGASTLALGLAARWPGGPARLVEADPAGGDVAAWHRVHHEPGLATMALAARHGPAGVDPGGWVQVLPCGVQAVLAAPGTAAAASLAALGEQAGRMLQVAAGGHPVVVDAGRWRPGSPADALLAACDVSLLVLRGVVDQVRQAEALLGRLRQLVARLELVVVEQPRAWPAGEVAAALGVGLAGTVPVDRQGAGVLGGRLLPRTGWGNTGWWGWTRLALLRSCHTIARQLAAGAASMDETGAASMDETGAASVDAAVVPSWPRSAAAGSAEPGHQQPGHPGQPPQPGRQRRWEDTVEVRAP